MRAVDIFIAYAHNDLGHKNELKKFLRPLINTGQARVWDDYEIEGGQNWEAEIKKRLYGSDIILLLVSPDSLASEYFYGQEVKVSLERHEKGEAKVVPVILRPCTWSLTPLKQLEALPEKGRPVTSWASQDEAYTDIAHNVGNIVENRQAVIATASRKKEQQREFAAAVEAAEHLFHKNQWSEAQKAFSSALTQHQPGFSPDRSTLESRIATCVSEYQREKDQATLQRTRLEYEGLLAAADDLENPKQRIPLLQKALALYQPGFSRSPDILREQIRALRSSGPVVTTSEATIAAFFSSTKKNLLLGGLAILLITIAVVAFLNSRDDKNPSRTPPKPETVLPAPDWKNATTIPALEKWIQENPGSTVQDRTDANRQLENWRGERKRDLADARQALQHGEHDDAKTYIQNVLQLDPENEEALLLKKKIPKR